MNVGFVCMFIYFIEFCVLNEICYSSENVRIFKTLGVVIEISHTSTNSMIHQFFLRIPNSLTTLLTSYVILKIIKIFY